ncbi:nicotinate phosphoribosyltransferase [Paraburkholderia sp. UCT31]|uniref:nicotinate phosphoribosyltransferase n=1 Tax=Paraburkholderia sp. UCT31 TaxID=2615209 RepID=UPI0016550662|nr:nicotinate phosphoribosyltransferase [Paraburkholderia sp. UCT31]MBC8741698.1 nicotinate phosphoribosyltransferase [Paraburkholderia sp. UCT31]
MLPLQSHQPVITSLLDTDLYKFTMMQAILHAQPGAQAQYRFKCRNAAGKKLGLLKPEIDSQLDHLCTLRFTQAELNYLGALRFMKRDFVDFLRFFQLQREYIKVSADPENPDFLDIVAEGPMLHVMLFEIYVLAIVNEVYFRQHATEEVLAEGQVRLEQKLDALDHYAANAPAKLNPLLFFEFGTRRRFSRAWQETVLDRLVARCPDTMRGTSNVYYAMHHNLTPIGTMAHEYLQAYQAFDCSLRRFQVEALDAWAHEYRGDLGIALTDVVGLSAFLRDFDMYFCKLFDGARHDSGDPVEWGDRLIAHYEAMRVDPKTKMLTFSDGLTIPEMLRLYVHFADRAKVSFGVGTNLTNDLGLEPLQNVMKLVRCNGQPVAKVSDSPGKTMCDDAAFLNNLKQVFAIA